MTIDTLKQLIRVEADRCETIEEFMSQVMRLINLYDADIERTNSKSSIDEINSTTDYKSQSEWASK